MFYRLRSNIVVNDVLALHCLSVAACNFFVFTYVLSSVFNVSQSRNPGGCPIFDFEFVVVCGHDESPALKSWLRAEPTTSASLLFKILPIWSEGLAKISVVVNFSIDDRANPPVGSLERLLT